jgi:hypothetical protein
MVSSERFYPPRIGFQATMKLLRSRIWEIGPFWPTLSSIRIWEISGGWTTPMLQTSSAEREILELRLDLLIETS